MKIVRTSVFETNSSSCHSLVMNFVSSEKELDEDVQSCIKGKNQIVVTLDGYYNSSPAYSLEDKLSYIFSDVLQDYEDLITVTQDEKLKQETYEGLPIEAIISLFNSGFGQTAEVNIEVVEKARKEKKEFDKLWKFVEKETGLPIVLEVHDRGMVYVDHESYGLGSQVLSMSKKAQKSFLFDSRNYFSLPAA